MKISLIVLLTVLAGCSFVGNSPEERRQRKYLQIQEENFNRQKYERRYAPAVEETDAFFTFTNRLSQRDTEPMDLADLGKLMVGEFGTNIAWQIVITAWNDYSHGSPINEVSNVMYLVDQPPRARDCAWMINFSKEWIQ